MHKMHVMTSSRSCYSSKNENKNLAIANRSRVSCANNTLRATILHLDLEI